MPDHIDTDVLLAMQDVFDRNNVPDPRGTLTPHQHEPPHKDVIVEAMVDVGDINAIQHGIDVLFTNPRLRETLFRYAHPPGQHPVENSLLQLTGMLHAKKIQLMSQIPAEDNANDKA